MSETPSDQYPDGQMPFEDVPLQDIPMQDPRPVTGRTIWDLLAGKGILILGILIAIVVAVILVINRDEIDWKSILLMTIEFVREYWYVAVGPIVGLILGGFFAKMVHKPDCRVVITLNVENHTVQALVVPEQLFRFLNQTGNNVVYHSRIGTPVYLANAMDLQRGFVDYGWVHEHDPLVVFTQERFYTEWKDTLDKAMSDNLNLMDSPEVYGMQFAGEALKRHLDRVAVAVGVMKESSGGPSEYQGSAPVPETEGGDENGS